MKIACHYGNAPSFLPMTHEERGIGGTENFACYLAKALANQGHQVSFYNQAEIEPTNIEGIRWANLSHFDPSEPVDVLVSFRMREVFHQELAAKLKVLILADTESYGLGNDVREGKIDVVMPVSKWQLYKIAREEGLTGDDCWMLGSNGIDMAEFTGKAIEKQPGMCIHTSTPERGLSILIDIWPHIEQSKLLADKGIQPELHLFSSFLGWGMTEEDNEKMCVSIYPLIESMIADGSHVINHKHVPRDVLREYQLKADVFLYPTNFLETYCISLTESLAAGVIPVVSNQAALPERVRDGENGFLVGEFMHDATTPEAKDEFVRKAVQALWLSDSVKKGIRELAIETARNHDYEKLAYEWSKKWESRL